MPLAVCKGSTLTTGVLAYWRTGETRMSYAAMLYINLPMLKSLLLATPAFQSLSAMPKLDYIEDMENRLGYVHSGIADVLKEARLKLNRYDFRDGRGLQRLKIGDVMSFCNGVRARGGGRLKARHEGTGAVYIRSGQFTASLPVSSHWITGDHARVLMGRGSLTLCGVFSIAGIDRDNNAINCTPILLAEPSTQLARGVLPDSGSLMCFTV